MTTASFTQCPKCQSTLPGDALVCSYCGAFVHGAELNRLSLEAQRLEAADPVGAATVWRHMLQYLPTDSNEYRAVAERAGQLASGFAVSSFAQTRVAAPRPRAPRSDDLNDFVLKTGGSMLLSILLFAWSDGWRFATAFVLLIFIHEMGHVVANWYFGIKQSAPIFLGYFGAVIMLREEPRDATIEGIIGIAGPIAGTIGAVACYYLGLHTGDPALLTAAFWGFFINAWNLIPVPPLDGGRAAAAISPLLWGLGIVLLVLAEGWFFLHRGGGIGFGILILFWILQSSFPRLRGVLLHGQWRDRYYRNSILTKLAMSGVYLGLLGFLTTRIVELSRMH